MFHPTMSFKVSLFTITVASNNISSESSDGFSIYKVLNLWQEEWSNCPANNSTFQSFLVTLVTCGQLIFLLMELRLCLDLAFMEEKAQKEENMV